METARTKSPLGERGGREGTTASPDPHCQPHVPGKRAGRLPCASLIGPQGWRSVTAGPGQGPVAGCRSRALEHPGSKGFLRAGALSFREPEPGTVLEIKAGSLDSGSKPRGKERSASMPPGRLQEKQGPK